MAPGVAANLLPKVGPRPLMIPGLVAGAVGMLLLAQLEPDSAYFTHLLPAMVIMSLGMAFVFIPTATVALHGVDHHDAGVASAMINTSQQVGGSLGTALMNTVAVSATSAYLVANAAAGETAMPAALTEGFTRGFYVGAALLLTAAVVVFFMIRIGADAAQDEDEAAPVHLGMSLAPGVLFASDEATVAVVCFRQPKGDQRASRSSASSDGRPALPWRP